ncbi:MAG: hypothetical protein ACREDR_38415 [Blastocatellia bacterium]
MAALVDKIRGRTFQELRGRTLQQISILRELASASSCRELTDAEMLGELETSSFSRHASSGITAELNID